jgi:hypothetical protein
MREKEGRESYGGGGGGGGGGGARGRENSEWKNSLEMAEKL